MKYNINFIITGIIGVEAETYEEAESVLEEMSLEEMFDDADGYTVIYKEVPLYEH